MARIQTDVKLRSISDLTERWAIAATRTNEGWLWCGSLAVPGENHQFCALAFPEREHPHISVVTGRDRDNREILYARIYPANLRRKAA
jgi:hypothetical protein